MNINACPLFKYTHKTDFFGRLIKCTCGYHKEVIFILVITNTTKLKIR